MVSKYMIHEFSARKAEEQKAEIADFLKGVAEFVAFSFTVIVWTYGIATLGM